MDKVTIMDASAEYVQVELLGPAAEDVFHQLGLAAPSGESTIQSGQLYGGQVRLLAQGSWGYRLLFSNQIAGDCLQALAGAGAVRLAPESYAVLRVEAGRPEAGQELTEEYTPLETSLDWAISDTKGCYTGQEVIARQITYDKVTRRLVGLKLEKSAGPGDRLWPVDEKRPAGAITSAVDSPRYGPIALAIIRRPHESPGTILRIGDQDSHALSTVTPLPFSSEQI